MSMPDNNTLEFDRPIVKAMIEELVDAGDRLGKARQVESAARSALDEATAAVNVITQQINSLTHAIEWQHPGKTVKESIDAYLEHKKRERRGLE